MENQAQTPSAPETPAAAGPSAAELQAQIDTLKKESEGRLRDLQSERTKRQELEARLTPPTVAPVESEVPQDELGKVLKPYIEPLAKRVKLAEDIAARTLEDKAMDHLVAKTGKTKQQLLEDRDFQNNLVNISKRYGFGGNIYDVTVKSYEIMELEKLRASEAERRRAAEANANASVPAGAPVPPAASVKEWDQESWSEMPLHEYEKYASTGTFHQSKDGKIVFTPKQ